MIKKINNYQLSVKVPYNQKLIATFKSCPGCLWDGKTRSWFVPIDLMPFLSCLNYQVEPTIKKIPPIPKDFIPPQKDLFERFFREDRIIGAIDTGGGKTRVAVEVIKASKDRALIVIPPKLLNGWLREFKTWWPTHPEIKVFSTSKDITNNFQIAIMSYEIFKNFEAEKLPGLFIFDEAHYLQHYTSQRSKHAAVLFACGPKVLLLTATPTTNKPESLYNLVNLLWPGRLGGFTKFRKMYCTTEFNDAGYEIITGFKELRRKELSLRFAQMSVQAPKEEFGQYLSELTTELLPVGNKNINTSSMKSFSSYMQAVGVSKIEDVGDYIAQNSLNHIHLVTYYRRTAKKYYKILTDLGFSTYFFTGETPPKKRDEIIAEASNSDESVLITSMKAVCEGLDTLTYVDIAIIAELYSAPGIMSQLFGRYQRLGQKKSTKIVIPFVENSHDEIVSQLLLRKIENTQNVYKVSTSTKQVSNALLNNKKSDEELLAELEAFAENFRS